MKGAENRIQMPGQRSRRRQFILIFAATFPSGQTPDVSGRLLNLLCASFPQGKPFVVGTAQVYYSGFDTKNQEGEPSAPGEEPCRRVKRSAAQIGLPGHFWTAAKKRGGQDGGEGREDRAPGTAGCRRLSTAGGTPFHCNGHAAVVHSDRKILCERGTEK